MRCEYLRKRCKVGCDKYVCRAFFPNSQPIITPDQLPMCQEDGHVECPRFEEGREFHVLRLEQRRKLHCPFASNDICSKPWDWWCKGGVVPFELTIPEMEVDAGGRELLKRDEEGNIVFKRGLEDIKDTCLIGNPAIYEECPNYKAGMALREEWRRVKGFKAPEE